MIKLLLLLQLVSPFLFPMTSAYAAPDHKDVVVFITYTDQTPITVCASIYALDDVEMQNPTQVKCVDKIHAIGDSIIFQDLRIDEANFMVLVKYPTGPSIPIYMLQKIWT